MSDITATPLELPLSKRAKSVKALKSHVAAFAAGMLIMTVALKVLDSFGNEEKDNVTVES